jgi:hypothetical protein
MGVHWGIRRGLPLCVVAVAALTVPAGSAAELTPAGPIEVRYSFEGFAGVGGSGAAGAGAATAGAAGVGAGGGSGGFGGSGPKGRPDLAVSAAAGGGLRAEEHSGGLAVRFPQPCRKYGDRACPRAIIETSFAANPGTAPLRYGAVVRLTPGETAYGENVLQKGFSHGHSQFKLQIDGAAGQPSCVLVGTASTRIHVATAGVTVANGQWHTVECSRAGPVLTITVDGAVAGQSNIPAALSIVNRDPLRIGGKGISPNNDQFHGALDDVFVSIGA